MTSQLCHSNVSRPNSALGRGGMSLTLHQWIGSEKICHFYVTLTLELATCCKECPHFHLIGVIASHLGLCSFFVISAINFCQNLTATCDLLSYRLKVCQKNIFFFFGVGKICLKYTPVNGISGYTLKALESKPMQACTLNCLRGIQCMCKMMTMAQEVMWLRR